MLQSILTILTNLVKKMFKRYWLGPISMAATLAIIYAATRYAPAWVTPSLVLAVIPMTISQYFGGLRSSLVCAVMASFYVFWSPNFDLSRAIQISGSFAFAAWLGGVLKQRERHLENVARAMFANGNIQKMRDAMDFAKEIKEYAASLTPAEVDNYANLLMDRIGNTLAIIDGYYFIRQEIERVKAFSDNPANAKWFKEMMEIERISATETPVIARVRQIVPPAKKIAAALELDYVTAQRIHKAMTIIQAELVLIAKGTHDLAEQADQAVVSQQDAINAQSDIIASQQGSRDRMKKVTRQLGDISGPGEGEK